MLVVSERSLPWLSELSAYANDFPWRTHSTGVTEFESVLIYDGECPYCSVAARALERIEDIGAISWYDEAAQSFLRAQFDATPFAMVLVDASQGQVYAGRSAAEELTGRAGLPDMAGSLVRSNYDTIARVVGLASRRGREPADLHDRYDLTAGGVERYELLAARAVDREIPERPESSSA
jgi:predicted DCC family thiol-disulfide oxidoreductase YuxK